MLTLKGFLLRKKLLGMIALSLKLCTCILCVCVYFVIHDNNLNKQVQILQTVQCVLWETKCLIIFCSDFFPANEYLSSGEYLGEVLPGWQVAAGKAKLSPGSPLILILCSSAIRAVQLNR